MFPSRFFCNSLLLKDSVEATRSMDALMISSSADDEIMSASIDLVASTLSLSKSELQKNLDGNKQALQALTNTSFHLAAMDFLVSKAHFTFEDDDGDDTNSIDDSTTP